MVDVLQLYSTGMEAAENSLIQSLLNTTSQVLTEEMSSYCLHEQTSSIQRRSLKLELCSQTWVLNIYFSDNLLNDVCCQTVQFISTNLVVRI